MIDSATNLDPKKSICTRRERTTGECTYVKLARYGDSLLQSARSFVIVNKMKISWYVNNFDAMYSIRVVYTSQLATTSEDLDLGIFSDTSFKFADYDETFARFIIIECPVVYEDDKNWKITMSSLFILFPSQSKFIPALANVNNVMGYYQRNVL